MQRCVRLERLEILFEMNFAFGIVITSSLSPMTTVWYQPTLRMRDCSKLDIVILSRSVNGFVRKSKQPPIRFVRRSFVARPTAMPPTPAKLSIEFNLMPVEAAKPSAQTKMTADHSRMPEPRRAIAR